MVIQLKWPYLDNEKIILKILADFGLFGHFGILTLSGISGISQFTGLPIKFPMGNKLTDTFLEFQNSGHVGGP